MPDSSAPVTSSSFFKTKSMNRAGVYLELKKLNIIVY